VERQEATLAPHEAQPLIEPIREPIPVLTSLSRPHVFASTRHNNQPTPSRSNVLVLDCILDLGVGVGVVEELGGTRVRWNRGGCDG
jgi:hypothetical protein